MKKVIIIGSGPAGLTSAIYTARANLEPLVISGATPGGQLTITTEVDNFPGFPEGIMGPELMNDMKAQAERFNTEFVAGDVEKVDFSKRPFSLLVEGVNYLAESVIVATGASARLLGIPSETKYMGRGVSACATCDAFFYKGKEVLVIGGGDTALEEAIFLTKFANKVSIVHRRDALRGSKILQDKALKNEKIKFLWDSVIDEILGEGNLGVTGTRLKNVKTNELYEVKCDGVFIAIGHSPNTEIFKGILKTNDAGYIETSSGTKTSIDGVFAAGDVQDYTYRQAVSAAGSGCMAAIDAERFLEG